MKRSQIDHPAIWGEVAYFHSKPVQASFAVASKIAQAKTPHRVVENLIKPAAVKMVRIMNSNVIANNCGMVPLSNNTVKQSIQEILLDVLQQTIGTVKLSGKFSLQLEEITDISNVRNLRCLCDTHTCANYPKQFLFLQSINKKCNRRRNI